MLHMGRELDGITYSIMRWSDLTETDLFVAAGMNRKVDRITVEKFEVSIVSLKKNNWGPYSVNS